jgi:hypothetical protein
MEKNKVITVEEVKLRNALSLKMKYQSLTDEYKKLGEIINQARGRRTTITDQKDKVFNELSEALDELG